MQLGFHRSQTRNRGQTGVGSAYALTFMILIMSIVLSFGYVYITTPAISASDTTPEASTVGDYLVTEEFSGDVTIQRSASGPRLDSEAVESFFISENTGPVETHRIMQNHDLDWNVSLINADGAGNSSIFNGNRRVSVGEPTAIGGVSTYRTPAILEGEVVIVEVNTWE